MWNWRSDSVPANDTAFKDFFTGAANVTVKETDVFEIADSATLQRCRKMDRLAFIPRERERERQAGALAQIVWAAPAGDSASGKARSACGGCSSNVTSVV
jgi:hypothetical protein